ncbi:MAG TPA: DUF4167 domain-containing protein [Caulobacteraceae bacterium]|nr:DUF4167 domain-containing protein [Caulobacteraceae bacterium]
MRDFKGMKRQRGRNRGGGNQGKPQQNANRAFESNGPDNVKIRGNAQHVFERYQQLARDAASSGDRVLAENYLQHAEHYFRVIRALQPNRPTQEIIGRETYSSGFDIDFEDESGAQAEPETPEQPAEGDDGQQQQRQDRFEGRQRDDRQRDDRQRDYNRDRDDRDRQRDERPRDDRDRQRDDRQRDFNRDRDDRPRDRDDRPRDRDRDRDRPFNRERDRDRDRGFNRDRDRDRDRPYRDERAAEPAAEAAPAPEPAPEPQGAVLRSEDGGMSQMPAFLQAREPRSEPEAGPADAPKPRRRRAPRASEPAGSEEA